jgi:hypothetical protein
MNILPVVIISAPQGSNKTSHANALANRFGCTRIVEEWDGVSDLQPGDLALTNIPAADFACVAEKVA